MKSIKIYNYGVWNGEWSESENIFLSTCIIILIISINIILK